MNICFFTVAKGESYAHIANTLAFTFKKHSKYTLEIFTDYPEYITFGNTHNIEEFEHDNYMFKFEYMRNISKKVDADYYVYIDADTYIVKNFDGLESIITKYPIHVFLENELTDSRYQWHGKNLEIIGIVFNEISKRNITYYNVNGGFFGIQKNKIEEVTNRAYETRDLLKNKLTNNFTEEYILSYLAGEYISDVESHLLHNNFDYYSIDTGHLFSNKLPENSNWSYKEWFSDKKYDINPSIVHLPGNKNVLQNFSKELLSSTLSVTTKERKTKKNKLNYNFIIACSRPYNLPFVLRSIERQANDSIDYTIWVVCDLNKDELDSTILNFLKRKNNINIFFNKDEKNKISGGNTAKNFAIDKIENGWVYQLDDDNLLHPKFIQKTIEYITTYPDKKCFIFSQNKRYYPKTAEDIKCGIIDTAMYILDISFIGDARIPESYGGDGIFIEEIFKKNPNECLIIDEVLCFYNILEKLG